MSGRPRQIWATVAIALVLVGLTVAIYAQTRAHDFVDFDDGLYVKDNAHVTGGLTAENVAWAFTTGHAANWHPLTWISHQLDVSLFGMDAGWHHLTNVAWHALNTLLLFGLLRAMTGSTFRSALVAALFGVHPSHVESVAWVSERKDVLSTAFWLATTWAWVAWTRHPSNRRYGAVLVLFALGLMSKPMLITLPFTLLLLDVWPLRRTSLSWTRRVTEKLPLVAMTIASTILTIVVQQRGGAVSTLDIISWADRVSNAVVSYGTYLRQLLWPANLAAFYPYRTDLPVTTVAVSAGTILACSVLAWQLRRAHPYLLVGWLWFLGTLVPVIGLIQIGMQATADRYTYVPSIGLFVALAWGIAAIGTRFRGACQPLRLAGVAGVLLLAWLAHAQAATWRTSEALWLHAVTVTKDNAKAHNSLGAIYGNSGRVAEAEVHFREAWRLQPDMTEGLHILPNLGRVLMEQGKTAEALPFLERAREFKPNDASLLYDLGMAYLAANRGPDAIAAWQQAVRANPRHEQAWFTLGFMLAAEGKVTEARQAFTEVLRINPNRQEAAQALSRLPK